MSSGDADGLPEQPHDERELDHEERVQPRPVHHEAVHRDPRPVVLQVRHQRLPLLEADVVGLERHVLWVVERGALAPAVVVVVAAAAGLVAGGHAVGVGGRQVARGGRQVRVRVLLVVVEGVHRGVRVPRRRHARHRLRLVRDLRRAVQAHQQTRHKADRAQRELACGGEIDDGVRPGGGE